MKICPGCQKTFDNADAFCDVCGGKLVSAETVAGSEGETLPKKKGLLWWHILLIVMSILVVAGIVFAVIYFAGKDNDPDTDGEENISEEDDSEEDDKNSGGLILGDDETITDVDTSLPEEESETSVVPEEESETATDDNNQSDDTNTTKPGSTGNTNSNPGSTGNTGSNSGSGGNTSSNSGSSGNTSSGNTSSSGNGTSKPASSGVGDAKVDACINAFFAGKYYMSYYDVSERESLEFAIDGNNFQLGMESDGLAMRIISLNGKMYIVNHKDKYIDLDDLAAFMGDENPFSDDTFDLLLDKLDISKYNFKSSTKGTANVDGKNLSYEKYIADDAELYFYYTSGALKRITLDADDDSADFDFEVDTFSATIPNNVLNLDALIESNILEFAFDLME